MIAALFRFISKAGNQALLFFKLLKKGVQFEWTKECEKALTQLKVALSIPPILTRPLEGETLYLYFSVSKEALSAILIQETDEGQRPVYFVCKNLY